MTPSPAEQQQTWRSNLLPASCPSPLFLVPRVGRQFEPDRDADSLRATRYVRLPATRAWM